MRHCQKFMHNMLQTTQLRRQQHQRYFAQIEKDSNKKAKICHIWKHILPQSKQAKKELNRTFFRSAAKRNNIKNIRTFLLRQQQQQPEEAWKTRAHAQTSYDDDLFLFLCDSHFIDCDKCHSSAYLFL